MFGAGQVVAVITVVVICIAVVAGYAGVIVGDTTVATCFVVAGCVDVVRIVGVYVVVVVAVCIAVVVVGCSVVVDVGDIAVAVNAVDIWC